MKNIFLTILFLFTTSLLKSQDEAQIAFNSGVKLLKAENYVEAKIKFSEAIQKGKNENGLKMSYVYKAFAQNGLGEFDSAIVSFNKAIEYDSLDAASYIDRGKTYSYLKNYDKAIIDLSNAIIIDTTGKQSEVAYYYLGRIKLLQWKNEEAIAYFDKLLKIAPTDYEVYYLRGTAKSNLMDIDGSINDYDKAIKYNPNYMEAYANRGVQKINKIPVNEKTGKKIKCLPDPCADFLKAKQMGDITVDDMIFLYCSKCK